MENYVVLFLQRFDIRVYLLQSGAVKRMYCTYIHVHICSIAFGNNYKSKLGAHWSSNANIWQDLEWFGTLLKRWVYVVQYEYGYTYSIRPTPKQRGRLCMYICGRTIYLTFYISIYIPKSNKIGFCPLFSRLSIGPYALMDVCMYVLYVSLLH